MENKIKDLVNLATVGCKKDLTINQKKRICGLIHWYINHNLKKIKPNEDDTQQDIDARIQKYQEIYDILGSD